MSGELTKEQLLEYVKKQKIKIKKLEIELAAKESQSIPDTTSKESSEEVSAELLQRIKDLENVAASKDLEISSKNRKIGDLEQSLSKAQEERRLLQEDLASLEEQLVELQSSSKQNKKLEQDYEKLRRSNDELQAEFTKWKDMAQQDRATISAVNSKHDQLLSEYSLLEAKYKDLVTQQVQEKENWQEDLNQKVDEFQRREVETKELIESLRQQLSSATGKSNAEHSNELSSLHQELQEKEKDLELVKQQLEEERRRREELSSSLQQEQVKAREALAKSEERVREMEASLSTSKGDEDKEQQRLLAEIESLKQSLKSQTEVFEKERMQWHEAGEKLKKLLKKEDQIAKTESDQDLGKDDEGEENLNDSFKETLKEHKSRIEELLTEIVSLQEQLLDLRRTHDLSNSHFEVEKRRAETLLAERDEEKRRVEILSEELKSEQSRNQQLKQNHEVVAETVQQLSKDKNSLQDQIDALNEKLSISSRSFEALERQYLDLQSSLEAEKEIVVQLTAEKEKVLDKMESESVRSSSALNQLRGEVERERQEHKEALHLLSQQVEDERRRREELSSSLQQEQVKAREALAKSEERLREMEASKMDDADEKQRVTSIQLQEAQQLLNRERAEREQVTAEKEVLQQELQTINAKLLEASQAFETLQRQNEELKHSRSAEEASTEEVERVKSELASKEDLNKKLTMKLKQKMKEANDLQEKLDFSAKEMKDWQEKVSQSHTQLSELNNLLLTNEGRISTLLAEKNSIRDRMQELEALLQKSSTDLELQLREVSRLKASLLEQTNLREQSDAERKSLTTALTDVQQKLAIASKERQLYEEQSFQHQATIQQLQERIRQSESSTQDLSSLREGYEKDKGDYLLKEKKYKAMLLKLNNNLQEKESKIQQYEALYVKRPKRFQVLLSLKLNSSFLSLLASTSSSFSASSPAAGQIHSLTPDAYSDWCYIFIDSPPHDLPVSTASPVVGEHGETSSSAHASSEYSKYRWIEASVMQEWVSQGSSVIGVAPSQSIDQLFSRAYNDLKEVLSQEKTEILNNYQDIVQQFQAYKQRAQTALKRMNIEDRERLQKQEQENQETLDLKQEIEEIRAIESQLREQVLSFQQQLQTTEEELAEKNRTVEGLEQRNKEIQIELSALQTASLRQKEELSERDQAVDRLSADLQQLRDAHEQKLKELEEITTVSHYPQNHLQAPVPLAIPILEKGDENLASRVSTQSLQSLEQSTSVQNNSISSPALSPSHSSHGLQRSSSQQQSQNPNHGSSTTDSTNKLLVFQQADTLRKENIQILREENSNLMLEVMELRSDLTLCNEQIEALKATVRELEASLLREQEFNASNRRLNADYLVNILRKFLMTTDPSERSKLVSVLCSILHLQPEETREIADKWAVKTTGLVGWLLPQAPAAAPTHNIAKGKSSQQLNGGDLTYDPVTGGGIEFSSY